MSEVGILPVDGGYIVKPKPASTLPGIYISYVKAEQALDKYNNGIKKAVKKKQLAKKGE